MADQPCIWKHLRVAVFSLGGVVCLISLPITRTGAKAPVTSYLPTKWIIKVDVTDDSMHNKRETPLYSVESAIPPASANGCPGGFLNSSPTDLTVCQGDTIKWDVATNNGDSHMRIFLAQSILSDDDGNTKKTHRVGADEKKLTNGGVTDSNVPSGTYDYCVAVFDRKGNYLYIDDPKIIIGTGQLTPGEKILRNFAVDLKKLDELPGKSPAFTEDLDKLRGILDKLAKDLPKK